MDNQTIDTKQAENVTFNGVTLEHKMSTSFDKQAKKAEESEDITLKFDLNGVTLPELFDQLKRQLAIKANNVLKKNGVDSETYRAYIKRNKNKFTFTFNELADRPRTVDPVVTATRNVAKMTDEEYEAFMAAAAKLRQQSA